MRILFINWYEYHLERHKKNRIVTSG